MNVVLHGYGPGGPGAIDVALLPEPEAIRSSYHPGGWTLEAFEEPAARDYLFGSIQNRFVKTS